MAVKEALQSYLPRVAAQLSLAVCLPLLLSFYYLSSRFVFPPQAPKQVRGNHLIVGAIGFFTERWNFCQQGARSLSGNYSFHLGKHPVIGVSGEEGRRTFYESKQLGFAEGYTVMSGQAPDSPSSESNTEFTKYFMNRIKTMVRRENILRGLPQLISDTKTKFNTITASSSGIINPFDTIYKTVYQLTMRTVGCNGFASDPALLNRTLHLFEIIEKRGTPTGIVFPWLQTPVKVKKLYAGFSLFIIFQKIVNQRKKTGRRENDALQFMMDQGDSMERIIGFVIGALFAGQVQSGTIAAWVLSYLAENPKWMAKAREEVTAVAQKYNPQASSLVDGLATIPLDAWETEFPFLDCCLRDGIRLQLLGVAFRKNTSDDNIHIGGEIVPPGTFMTYHLGHIHKDAGVYHDPERWDPSRYLPERAEDKKVPFGYLGWGAGRHPCLGMRFAKLETNVIIAHFLAMLDQYHLCDANGEAVARLPEPNLQAHATSKLDRPVYLKVHRREG